MGAGRRLTVHADYEKVSSSRPNVTSTFPVQNRNVKDLSFLKDTTVSVLRLYLEDFSI